MSGKKSQTRGYFDAIRKSATGDKGKQDLFICEFCGAESSDPYYAFDKPFCDDEHAMEWAQERIAELESYRDALEATIKLFATRIQKQSSHIKKIVALIPVEAQEDSDHE